MLSLCNWVTKVLDPRTKYIMNYHCRESRGTWPGHTATTGAGKVQKSTITQLNYVNNKWTCSSQIKRHTVYTYSSLVQNENTSKLNLRHLTKTKKSYNSNVMCECVWCINTDLKQHNKLLSKRDKTNTNYEYGIWLEWKLYLHRITTEPPDAASVQPNTWRWVIHDANWVAHEIIWGGPKRTLQWPSNALYMYCGGRGDQVVGRVPSCNPSQLHTDPQDTCRLVSPTPHCTAHRQSTHTTYIKIGNNFAALSYEGWEFDFIYYMSRAN